MIQYKGADVTREKPVVVCAEPDEGERNATVEALAGAGLEVTGAGSIAAFETELDRHVDCVVTAGSFPDGDVFDVVDAVRAVSPDCACIIFTETSPSELPRGRADQVVEYVPRSIPDARDRLVDVVTVAAAEVTQAAFPMPKGEAERVAAVQGYDVESLATEATFERLTALMTSHFDIDIAFVGLVDEHEEKFIACEGANWRTLAREDTICTHTILTDEIMIVEDTREDPRFAANDTLADLDIRSYAGARIADEDGHVIGAVCCIDDEPRSYTQAERDDLRRFADEVEEQLLLRRRLDDREK